ncbi:MAG: hypothetical protein EA377_12345 [Phycisphaerales bacterium]|nr:MAG: hypothetical protein EA377_12345 [Phycisphaerales bacterium]
MTFSVGMPTPVEIIASWSGAGSGSWGVGAFPFILLEPVDQSNKIVLESLFGSGEANHNLLLQPGDYSLSVTHFASAGSETFSGLPVSDFSSSLNFEMTVIPAPGSVLLFSIGGLAARRRRTH